jgi:hypothetical protein
VPAPRNIATWQALEIISFPVGEEVRKYRHFFPCAHRKPSQLRLTFTLEHAYRIAPMGSTVEEVLCWQ